MSLPTPTVRITCGACQDEIVRDGGVLACYACGLTYPDVESPAEFADPSQEECGAPPPVAGPVRRTAPFKVSNHRIEQWRTTIKEFGSCHLPAEHMSLHDWPYTVRYEYHDTRPPGDTP